MLFLEKSYLVILYCIVVAGVCIQKRVHIYYMLSARESKITPLEKEMGRTHVGKKTPTKQPKPNWD